MGRVRWHLISNHGAAVIYFAARPSAMIREAAAALGMSQRRTAGIVRELVDAGILTIEKHGTHNHYRVNLTAPFPHPFLAHLPVGLMVRPVVEALTGDQTLRADASAAPDALLLQRRTETSEAAGSLLHPNGDDRV